MARRDFSSGPASAGFTLIEVLVALAIAALGLALLVAATGSGLQSATVADQYIKATGQAQSRLAQVGRTIPLRKGDYSGAEENGFHWRVQIAAPMSPPGAGPRTALYPVTVTESWPNGARQTRVSFYSERVGPP
jgi:general secretion pathway protein I